MEVNFKWLISSLWSGKEDLFRSCQGKKLSIFIKTTDIRGYAHFDEHKGDLWQYLHIGKFLNMGHSMTKNEVMKFFMQFNFFLSSFDRKKWNEQINGNRVHSVWTDKWPSLANCDFPVSVLQLHLESDGELNHHPSHHAGSSSQDTNVFLPSKFFLLRGFIHNHMHSTILDKHSNWKQNNFLQWLCNSVIFLSFVRRYRVLPFGCHVLWPVCCHLQTLALPNHYEQ